MQKSFYFEVLGDGKYSKFYPKSWCKMISSLAWNTMLTDYWNILLWFFWRLEIRSFFIQKVDGKIIFTWYFLVFDDILGLGKCGLWCSDRRWISIRINYHLIATNEPTNWLSRNLFYFQALFPYSEFLKEDWALGYKCTQFWGFINISSFPKILILKLFSNSWGNLYIWFLLT